MEDSRFNKLREDMVVEQILKRGIYDENILEAFRNVPRHIFVPDVEKKLSYSDQPLPIGSGQTISQPYMVALMTKSLELQPGMSVLEIGTGSGYQTAILLYLGAKVYSIERISLLADKAKKALGVLGFGKVAIKVGDGTLGWPKYASYDRIIVTASTMQAPAVLIEQLKIGGKLVIPLGEKFQQDLTVITRISADKTEEDKICGCIFVPLIGEYGWDEP